MFKMRKQSKGFSRLSLCYLLALCCYTQTLAQTIVYSDNMEESGYTWRGIPKVLTNSSYIGGLSNPNDFPISTPQYSSFDSCFALFGTGLGSSTIERDTLFYPNITGLDPSTYYQFRFKLASIGITPSVNTAAGVDGSDYVQISYSSNGGITFTPELRFTGASNSRWGFNGGIQVAKNASGTLTTFSPAGTPVTSLAINLPLGITQFSCNIIMLNNASGETWMIDDVELVAVTALPIELQSFTCEYTRDQNIVKWVVVSQINNDYFTLYRSVDGVKWDEIKRVAGEGTTTSIYVYEYVDREPCEGVIYYKLKQTDYDGLFEEFGPIASYCVLKDPEYLKWVNYLGQSVNENFKGPKIHYHIYK